VFGGDGTLGSVAGTDIGSGSKPGGTVGVLATVVGVGILAGPGSVISLKIVDNGNVAWQGLSTIHQQYAVTTCRGER
jgi:hypothetical protein